MPLSEKTLWPGIRREGSTFNPRSISGLQLWLDATNMGAFADGDPVGTWLDKSGNSGRDAAQSTTASKPTYKSIGGVLPNGGPSVFFTVDDFMVSTFSALAQPNYILLVWKPVNTGTGPFMIDGGPTGTGRHAVNPDFSANSLFYFAGTNQSYAWSNTNWQISEVVYNGASSNAWENNVQKLTNINMGAQSLIGLTIGARFSAASFITAYLRALVVVSRASVITNQERLNLYNYYHVQTGI